MQGKLDFDNLELQELEPSKFDKNELLHDIDSLHYEEKGLGLKTVLLGVSAMISMVAIVFPKIYINSNIYYMSLELNTLYSNDKSLREEQRFLKQKLEGVKYQQDILNAIR